MAIPETWAMTKERLRWTAATGSLERVQTWRGLAGVAEAGYIAWLANFSGYTSLERTAMKPQTNGNCVLDVEIGFAAQPDGTIAPPSSPDYGLIERSWEKHTIKEQEGLLSHWRVDPLYAYGAPYDYLPSQIRLAAIQYATDHKTYLKNEMAKEAGEAAGTPPNPQLYVNKIQDKYPALTEADKYVTAWLFSEYSADPNARWFRNKPVLSKTEIVLTVANLRPSHEDVDRILSPATFLQREATVEQAALIAFVGLKDMNWHKQSPVVQRTSNGWFKIAQEYHAVSYIAPQTIMRYGPLV